MPPPAPPIRLGAAPPSGATAPIAAASTTRSLHAEAAAAAARAACLQSALHTLAHATLQELGGFGRQLRVALPSSEHVGALVGGLAHAGLSDAAGCVDGLLSARRWMRVRMVRTRGLPPSALRCKMLTYPESHE